MSLDSSLLIFLGAGLAGGLLLGLIGVGIALVAVPLLTFALPRFGVPAEVAPLTAVATSMGVVAVSSVASAIAHQRLGNVDLVAGEGGHSLRPRRHADREPLGSPPSLHDAALDLCSVPDVRLGRHVAPGTE